MKAKSKIETTISIHAPREGGDCGVKLDRLQTRSISIHAPREGGDVTPMGSLLADLGISIHAPREGGDPAIVVQISPT